MIEGFFSKKDLESKTRPTGKSHSCVSCGLYKTCNNSRMAPFGKFKKGILNIGEAPGEVEDRVGKPWQGKTGKLLQQTYKDLGIDLFEDCLNINSIICRPSDKNGHNRTPTNVEIECCRKNVLKIIDSYKPKLIILLGNAAVYSLIGHRWKRDLGGIMKWRGWTIPDQDFKTWICPTFHPSYVERSDEKVEEVIWRQDLKTAFDLIATQEYQGKKFLLHSFPKYKEPNIEVIDDLYVLTNIRGGYVAFDYETTGLKPHAPGHRIVCCAIANGPDHAYVFMMPKTKKERQPLIDLLIDKRIEKVASNMKFEDTWTKVRLKCKVLKWKHDTMIMAHVLDNRPGITSLKFQAYINFGIVDYDSEISPYLEADKTNANSFNKILDLIAKPGGKESLLKYCGYDAIYEYRLAQFQIESMLPF